MTWNSFPAKTNINIERGNQSIHYYTILWTSIHSICSQLRQSFKRHFNVNLHCSFNTTKIKNFFSLKCPTPILLKANVVYKFNCLCDVNISYIGKTKRHLATKIENYRFEKSAIGQHFRHVKHVIIISIKISSKYKVQAIRIFTVKLEKLCCLSQKNQL